MDKSLVIAVVTAISLWSADPVAASSCEADVMELNTRTNQESEAITKFEFDFAIMSSDCYTTKCRGYVYFTFYYTYPDGSSGNSSDGFSYTIPLDEVSVEKTIKSYVNTRMKGPVTVEDIEFTQISCILL